MTRWYETLVGGAEVATVCRWLVLLYVTSLCVLLSLGFSPAIPWNFLPYLVFAVVPFSLAVVSIVRLMDGPIGSSRFAPMGAVVCGVAGLAVYGNALVWIPTALVLLAVNGGWIRGRLRPLSLALASLVFGYATVWNANYIAGWLVRDRLVDSVLQRSDEVLYALWLGGSPMPTGFFPLVRSWWGFSLLEHGYLALFGEVLIAVIWLSTSAASTEVGNFLRRLFLAYTIGLVVFLIFPAIGPFMAPASFDSAFATSMTHGMTEHIALEYRAVVTGGRLNGFGYFVGMPSLHAAVGVLVLGIVRRSKLLFWVLLPITTILVLSTFLLGIHYLLDTAAGVALGWLLVPSNQPPAPPPQAFQADASRN